MIAIIEVKCVPKMMVITQFHALCCFYDKKPLKNLKFIHLNSVVESKLGFQ